MIAGLAQAERVLEGQDGSNKDSLVRTTPSCAEEHLYYFVSSFAV
jgi:hypothetical protein